MNHKMLAPCGLKWNPFTPNVPTEALHVTPSPLALRFAVARPGRVLL